jgi:hypothetical protein
MFEALSDISDSEILLCFMGIDAGSRPFFNNNRVKEIQMDTGMRDYNTYEILGDAVYDVIFYNYVWRRKIPLDLYLMGRSKSNISMSCILMDSEIYPFIGILRKGRDEKTIADTFEALLGLVYSHLQEKKVDISEVTETWLIEVFDIGGVFYRLTHNRETPNGSYILPSEEVDVRYLYRLAIQKLIVINFLFHKYRYAERSSKKIHDIYDPYRGVLLIGIDTDIDKILDSDDILRDIEILSRNMNLN